MNQLITTTGSTRKHPIAGTIQLSMYAGHRHITRGFIPME
ncbi:11011_t:CDS:2 [Funneliformis caledonium]|uniref:11011_t:CDS:1 n=1 Tax=Funneliformis caledonium TaxID=1117310 RepID=A0A9N9C3S7_9GLOM|nr:11011_t:CDS:2 [Funneliformis caledonium]